jgi:hypothetical protein
MVNGKTVPLTPDEEIQIDLEAQAWASGAAAREKERTVARLRRTAEFDYITEIMETRAKDADAPASVAAWDNARK